MIAKCDQSVLPPHSTSSKSHRFISFPSIHADLNRKTKTLHLHTLTQKKEKKMGRTKSSSSSPYSMVMILILLMKGCGLIGCSVSYDKRAMIINGSRRILLSGSIHYPRSTPEVCSARLDPTRPDYFKFHFLIGVERLSVCLCVKMVEFVILVKCGI